jgi:hypothetical protein
LEYIYIYILLCELMDSQYFIQINLFYDRMGYWLFRKTVSVWTR